MRRPRAAGFAVTLFALAHDSITGGYCLMNEAVVNNTAQFLATVMKTVMGISAQGSATVEVKVLYFSRHNRRH